MCGFWAFKQLFLTLGFHTPPKKDQPTTAEMVLLGYVAPIRDTFADAAVRDGSIAKTKSNISHDLSMNFLTPEAARKLWGGGLRFYTSVLPGKLGRGMMASSIKRQYIQRGPQLSNELRRNLVGW